MNQKINELQKKIDALSFLKSDIKNKFSNDNTFFGLKKLDFDIKKIKNNMTKIQNAKKYIKKNAINEFNVELINDLTIDYEKELNSRQLFAATHKDGPLLVIAGAGSGKTRTIVYRVAYLLENKIDPNSILLLTFTRKAANEMVDRTNLILNSDNAKKVTAATFHSFANYALRRYSIFSGMNPNFSIIDVTDAQDIIDILKRELSLFKDKRYKVKKSFLYKVISYSRNCNIDIEEVLKREDNKDLVNLSGEIVKLKNKFQEYKHKKNILDYDDLLETFANCLHDKKDFLQHIQNRYQYIMVDEYQDTNLKQKEISDLIAQKSGNIVVVGDDFQSIYGFRGANFENILTFTESYPDAKVVMLEENYRTSQEILNFTNQTIKSAKLGFDKKLFSSNNGNMPCVKKSKTQYDEAVFVGNKIKEYIKDKAPNKIAVLYRANFHKNLIEAELLKNNISYVVYGGIRFIERKHVKDVLAHLKIVYNLYDAPSLNRSLKLIPQVGNKTAQNIMEEIFNNESFSFEKFEDKKFYKNLKKFGNLISKIKEDSLIEDKIKLIFDYYYPMLKGNDMDYKKKTLDIDILINIAEKYKDLEKFLTDLALDPPSDSYKDSYSPMLEDEKKESIVLSTIHSAKGLEWDVVFVIHLTEGLFPNKKSALDFVTLEEERRLFYVACTRAKEVLYLSVPLLSSYFGDYFTQGSRFIDEIESSSYLEE